LVKGSGRKPTDVVSFTLRLRESLRVRLEREGDKRGRSLNAEMIERLENSLGPDAPPPDQAQLVKEISAAVAEKLVPLIDKQIAESPLKTPNISLAQLVEAFARARDSADKSGDK
jgi:hypothetical protein